jgi:adenine-specific DNA-methyltransferase
MANSKTEIEKLNLNSMNIAEEMQNELLRLFPEVRTEGGKIDFEKLKLALGHVVDTGKERYGMVWPGKADCFKTVQSPSVGTLRPSEKCGINTKATQHLFLEGDNLEVLKLLQKGYLNKIKLIYIDPPYNTGSDFIYPDSYSENLQTYLRYTKQIDSEGYKFGTNSETDGRFHSKWMNMIYPRLYLARNLLRQDGLIFISIDENESDNLKKIVIEIFGEENFIGMIANTNNPKGRSDDKFIATAHEYLIVAAKDKASARVFGFEPEENITRRYNKEDSKGEKYREIDLRKTGDADRRKDRPDMFYFFYFDEKSEALRVSKEQTSAKKNEVEIVPIREDGSDGRWRWGFSTASDNLDKLIAKYMPNRKIWGVFEKDYLEGRDPVKPTSSWTFKDVNSERGSEQLIDLGFDKEVFPHPKPIGTMRRVLEVGTIPNEQALVLDFFAGSCSLFHAALELNNEGSRKIDCIMVQLPEELDQTKAEQNAGHKFCIDHKLSPNIAEISKERMRRAIKVVSKEIQNPDCDFGFRVFKLDSSNFKGWSQDTSKDNLEKQLELHVDHVKHERTADDILYEILLKSGFPLTTKVETQKFGKQTVYSIAGGMLLVCLEDNLTLDLIKHIAEQKPERVVCLDQGFANNDQLKTNAVQIFKTKGITKFQTV